MSEFDTDADVQALMGAIGCRMGTYAADPVCWTHDVMQFDGTALCPHAQEALDAVAPAIAARAKAEALREVAQEHRNSRRSTQEPIWPAQLDLRADEIEGAK